MKIKLMSVFDTFEYVMDHYYPFGMEEFAMKSDKYAVISIQDTHTDGFGIEFKPSKTCVDVLTLYFDDIVKPVKGAMLFDSDMAMEIINFVSKYNSIDTLVVHCYAGQSRSRAVCAFICKMLGMDNSKYFKEGSPNEFIYQTLIDTYESNKSST